MEEMLTVKEVVDAFTGSPEHMEVLVQVDDQYYHIADAGGYRQEFGAYVVVAGAPADTPDE